jgi:hypothetical protein
MSSSGLVEARMKRPKDPGRGDTVSPLASETPALPGISGEYRASNVYEQSNSMRIVCR